MNHRPANDLAECIGWIGVAILSGSVLAVLIILFVALCDKLF